MRKSIVVLGILLIATTLFGDGPGTKRLEIEEEDGSHADFYDTLKVTNGTLTDNLDGSVSLTVGGTSQWTTSGSNIYFTGGNIGIGTTAPDQELDVFGDIQINGAAPAYYWKPTSGDQWHMYAGAESYLLLTNYTDNKEIMRIENDYSVHFPSGAYTRFYGQVRIGAYTLPAIDGNIGYQLTTNGSGGVTWAAAGGVGGESTTVTDTATLDLTLTGTDIKGDVIILKDLVTTAPLAGATNDIFVGADSDITLSIADAAADGSTKGASTYTALDFTASSGVISLNKTATLAGNPVLGANNLEFATTGIIFEGATNDNVETLLTAADPTSTDKTITLPDATGTVAVSVTAPITLSATGDVGITVLKDIVTTAPLTGGTNDILVGADADITIAIPQATTSADGYVVQADWDSWTDHVADNTQAHSDYLINNGNDATTGNVGIGTTNPREALDVIGSGIFSTNVGIGTTAPTRQSLDVVNGAYFGGNVGIGTTVPREKLDVIGRIIASGNVGVGTTNPTQELEITGDCQVSNIASPAYYLKPSSGDTWHIYCGAESYLAISNYTHALELLTFTNDNNAVFYGSVEAASLHINGTGSFDSTVSVGGLVANGTTVNLSPTTNGYQLTYNSATNTWAGGAAGGAGGYTTLSQFVDETAWRVYYSNTDGDVTALALGAANTVLTSNGASSAPTFEAAAGGGPTYREYTFLPESAVLDDTVPPAITIIESSGTGTGRFRVADFDATTDERIYYTFVMPSDYTASSDIIVDIYWYTNDTGADEDAIWAIEWSSTTSADADTMAEFAMDADIATESGNCDTNEANRLLKTTITLTYATYLDGLAAGDICTFVLFRDADDSVGDADNDGLSSDARLVSIHLKIPRS